MIRERMYNVKQNICLRQMYETLLTCKIKSLHFIQVPVDMTCGRSVGDYKRQGYVDDRTGPHEH